MKMGFVWRVEVVSSTLIYNTEVKEAIQKALEHHSEFDEVLVEELYESIKLFRTSDETGDKNE